MSQPQKGICAEPNLHAQYLMYNVLDDDSQALRAKLARVLDIFAYFDDEHYEAMVSGVIAIGSDYFSEVYPGLRPLELSPFPDMQSGDRCAPSQTSDIFIQIRADRLDIVHAIATEINELLHLHVELVDDLKGFRYLDGRDLNGFVETDDNPRGPQKLVAAVIGDGDPDFVGGSYIHIQKYRHDLRRWSLLSERQQEQVIGRTKAHNLPSALANASSHYIRTRNADDGFHDNHNQMVRQSMPYANIQVQGLFQVTCSASIKPFKSMLHSMIFGGPDGEYDAWLDYTNAETGGAYFAPSIQFLRERAKD